MASCADTRTTTADFGGGCTESVTYQPCMTSDQNGDAVYFDNSGNPTYVNEPSCSVLFAADLLAFDGHATEKGNVLNWKFAQMPAELRLYKTSELKQPFALIAENLQTNTQYLDKNATVGTTYYQLEWNNEAGQIYYSPIIQVTSYENENAFVQFYPNPVRTYLNIQGIAKCTTIHLMTLTGKELLSLKACSDFEAQEAINSYLPSLNEGLYLLSIGEKVYKLAKID